MDSGKCALTGSLPELRLAWFSGQEGSAWRSPMATKLACTRAKYNRKSQRKNMVKMCNPARNRAKGDMLQQPSFFSSATVKNICDKYPGKVREIFKNLPPRCIYTSTLKYSCFFVKNSCKPACKLVPWEKVRIN